MRLTARPDPSVAQAAAPGTSTLALRTGRPGLPVDRTSRRAVPDLRRQGYEVDYREFAGGSVVPPEPAEQAADRLAEPDP